MTKCAGRLGHGVMFRPPAPPTHGVVVFCVHHQVDPRPRQEAHPLTNGGNTCVGHRCPNCEVCGRVGGGTLHWNDGQPEKHPMYFSPFNGRCRGCDVQHGRTFDILRGDAAEGAEDCSVCLDRKATVKFAQCSHRCCPACVHVMTHGHDGKMPVMRCPGRSDPNGRDQGCPICRAKTKLPGWAHTGREDCERCQSWGDKPTDPGHCCKR